MRFGVTGASGFIGGDLVKALTRLPGAGVVPFRRSKKKILPGPEDFKSFVRYKDLIFHLAGVNRGDDEEILRGNVFFTCNLLTAIKTHASASTRIVFASSSQVYKLSGAVTAVTERRAAEPETVYGVSKKTAEDLIRLSGLPHTILRLTNVYGPGGRPDYNSVIATFCNRAAHGRPLRIDGDGRQGRDFIYIDDAVRAFLLTADGNGPQGVFNVASGRVHSLRQIVSRIRKAGFDVQVESRPQSNPGGSAPGCDSSRFRKRTGWQPKVSLTAGIQNTLNGFEANRKP